MQRDFIVGSEWIYYKIYSGTRSADIILATVVEPLVNELLEKGIIDKYFFIRYADPNFHIRLRLHTSDPSQFLSVIINALYSRLDPYVKSKVVYDLQLNIYKREIERYGAHTIEDSESIFYLNSRFILGLVRSLDEDDLDARWLSGILFMDTFLDDFGLDLYQKKMFTASLAASFGEEFGSTKETKKHLGGKFRRYREQISLVLENSQEDDVQELLAMHSRDSKAIIARILEKNSGGTLNNLLASYIHMHCNRLFQNKQRAHEWLLYDMLAMYYQGKLARKQKMLTI